MFADNEGDLSSEEVKNNYQHIREEAELEKSDSEDDEEEDGELHVSEGSSNQNEAEETSVLRNPRGNIPSDKFLFLCVGKKVLMILKRDRRGS